MIHFMTEASCRLESSRCYSVIVENGFAFLGALSKGNPLGEEPGQVTRVQSLEVRTSLHQGFLEISSKWGIPGPVNPKAVHARG